MRCPTCGNEFNKNDSSVDYGRLIEDQMHSVRAGSGYYVEEGWDALAEADLGFEFTLGDLGEARVVHQGRHYPGYDDVAQGGEDYYIVIEVDSLGKFFRKNFHFDSYGTSTPLFRRAYEVTGTVKTVRVFE
jgi:hypothetical protein